MRNIGTVSHKNNQRSPPGSRRIKMKLYAKKSISGFIVCLVLVLLLSTLPITASAVNTSYYVDAVSGSDSNNGKSVDTAWKTLAKVNSTTFGAGDKILFKRGSSWTGTLYPKGSGASGNPITIDAYGSGALPVINGNGKYYTTSDPIDSAVYLRSQSHWVISNIEVTNKTTTKAERYGIHIDGSGGQNTGITIRNTKVHDVTNDGNAGEHARIAGIAVWARSWGDSFSNVLVEGNEVYNIGSTAIYVNGMKWVGSAVNNVIRNNYVHEIGGDGIMTVDCESPLAEYNVANTTHNQSTVACVAMWPFSCNNAVFQYNEAYNTKTTADGQGFDSDYMSRGTIFQYNYGHDNEGGFFLICSEPTTWDGKQTGFNDGTIVRYNIGQNNANWQFVLWTNITNTSIYNNVVSIKAGNSSPVIWSGSRNNLWYPDKTTFKNNIFYHNGTGGYLLEKLTGLVFDYNIFYGYHASSEPYDAHKLTNNPKFVKPGGAGLGITSCDAYKLQIGSPALNSGVLITNNGGKDYFGNPVSATAAPNRGAYNGPGIDSSTTNSTTTYTTTSISLPSVIPSDTTTTTSATTATSNPPTYSSPFKTANGQMWGLTAGGMSYEQFSTAFVTQPGITITVLSKDGKAITSGKIGTGMKVKVSENNAPSEEFSVILYGDIDGNGTIDVIDMVKMKMHILKINYLQGAMYTAANTDRDSKVTVNVFDMVVLKKSVLKINQIDQN